MMIGMANSGTSSENEHSSSVKSKSAGSISSQSPSDSLEYGNQNAASNGSSALSYYSYYDEQVSMHNKPRVIQGDPDQTLQE